MNERFWTVSELEEQFETLQEAREAWLAAGEPKSSGNTVWASAYENGLTLCTVTLWS
jgi:hypothetical protein